MHTPVFLAHRSIVSVSGADAETFLNNIVTVSTLGVEPGALRYGALLTPQGKIIAEMVIAREGDALLLDCESSAAPALIKRLSLMKLRAAVAIEERADLGVTAFEGSPDPREATAPRRLIGKRGAGGDTSAYHAVRITAGLPEQGFDFGADEVFPADINMDLDAGVDFKKGCFVGQEVVSRMKRRGTARRRTLKVSLAGDVAVPAPILANGFEIGMLTSISGGTGLARVRIDRLAEAQAKGETITAGDAAVTFDAPPWLAGELAAMAEAKEAKT
jgi:tRNA-modifying protein YgfZ